MFTPRGPAAPGPPAGAPLEIGGRQGNLPAPSVLLSPL